MQVTLYKFAKRANSTARPTSGDTRDGNVNSPCSILRPTMTFRFSGAPEYNYLYIPEFGRYYTIDEWTFDGGAWTCSTSVDVLASWREEIGDSVQYIARSSAEKDGAIIDTAYQTEAVTETVRNTATSPWDAANPSYIVGIISANSKNGAVTYYAMTKAQFESFSAFLLGTTDYWAKDLETATIETAKLEFNPIQYIASVTAVPWTYGGGFVVNPIPLGWWSLDVDAVAVAGGQSFTFSMPVPKHPQAARGVYLNAPPYSSYTLFVPVFGAIPLDGNQLAGIDTIFCQVDYSVENNSAILYVRSEAGGTIFYTAQATFGAGVQLGQFALSMGAQANSTLSFIDIFTSVFKMDARGMVDAANESLTSLFPQMATTGSNGTLSAFFEPPALQARFARVTADDNERLGAPLCKQKQVKSIPGFIRATAASVNITGTESERAEIVAFLEEGFYYE